MFTPNDQSKGMEILTQFEKLKQSLLSLNLQNHDPHLSIKLIELPISTVEKWLSLAKSVSAPKSFFSRLNPLLFIKHRRIQNILIELGETPTLERILQLQKAAELEFQQRPMRKRP